MSDLEDPANRLLTLDDPFARDGAPDGREARPEPGATEPLLSEAPSADRLLASLPAEPLASPPGSRPATGKGKGKGMHLWSSFRNTAEPSGPPTTSNVFEAAAIHALTGEPNAWTQTQWCKKCQVNVLPINKGECPRCHCALRLNFRARKHPINLARRDQLHDEIVVEYQPQTLELRDACRYLASVKERLETAKEGTPEHQRLMAMWTELSTQLRTASPAPPVSHTRGLSQMPVSALELAMGLLNRQLAGEVLSDFECGQLSVLRAAEDGQVLLPEDVPEV